MTTDDKARQVGRLLLEYEQATTDLAHAREHAREVGRRLSDAADGWKGLISVGGRLKDSDGHDVAIPTEQAVAQALAEVSGHEASVHDLRQRLTALGITTVR